MNRLLAAATVGHALETVAERYAESSTELSNLLEDLDFGADVADENLASTWCDMENTRNLILLGDPAARVQIPLNSYDS